jgi:ribosome maturation factor RimP
MTKIEKNLKNLIEMEEDIKFYGTETVKENDRTIFRVLIKTPNRHVSINDCVKISEIISPFLDVEEPINGEYTLEVSSPNIERKIEKPEHFKLSINEKFQITTKDSKYKGILKFANNEKIIIQDKAIDEIELFYNDILKAKTYFEF